MSAEPALAGPAGRLLAAVAARAERWLFEPAVPAEPAPPTASERRPLVVVAGIASGCGATTVARALAAELASRDSVRSAVVSGAESRGGLPLGTPAAGRLARLVCERAGVDARPSGRLCLAPPAPPSQIDSALRGLAPIVLDAGGAGAAGPAASLADCVVLVAAPKVEPALAAVVAGSLGRVGPEPVVVLNRCSEDPDAWLDRADLVLPVSPAAARLALSGRGAAGAFGVAICELANACDSG